MAWKIFIEQNQLVEPSAETPKGEVGFKANQTKQKHTQTTTPPSKKKEKKKREINKNNNNNNNNNNNRQTNKK